MKPIRPGDRGPAVEDIQRRLLVLGYDLGPTGVDGVFLGRTGEALCQFQSAQGLAEAGSVGAETWSALVDATFTLGDRMLYLRLPHFHGHDVAQLQQALNALGFACGEPDGIFGTFTEHAVREFQRNAGLPSDGILGPGTSGAIFALRHVWEGKDPRAHSAARLTSARAAEVLTKAAFSIGGLDDAGKRIAGRVVNLALATTPEARVALVASDMVPRGDRSVTLWICGSGTTSAVPGRPVVSLGEPQTLGARLLTAVASSRSGCSEVVIEADLVAPEDEHAEQGAAVALLDAACVAFD